MADYYCELSEVLTHLTPKETAWLRSQLEIVYVLDGKEGADPEKATWIGCRAYRDLEDYDEALGDEAGFSYSFSEDDGPVDSAWGPHLWLHSDYGCLDHVAHLVQKFLREFRPDQSWSATYAVYCTKPRVGDFGAGAVFVTADEIKYVNSYEFVDDQQKEHKAKIEAAKTNAELSTRLVPLIAGRGAGGDLKWITGKAKCSPRRPRKQLYERQKAASDQRRP